MNRFLFLVPSRLALVAAMLLSATTTVRASDPNDHPHGNTPLHLAALRGDVAALERLLGAGADPNVRNDAGATPLHYATMSEPMVAALLAAGAEPDVVSDAGLTPLLGAAGRPDSFPVVQRLAAAGANLNAHRRERRGVLGQANVLAVAIMGGDPRTIAFLLDRGAEVNPRLGAPPLMAAAVSGNIEVARELLARGAELNVAQNLPGSALNAAFFAGNRDFARFLIEQGADLTIPSRGGTTAMIWSAYHDTGDADITRELVARGADIHVSNDEGETALSYALKSAPDTELVRYLHELGAETPNQSAPTKVAPRREIPPPGESREALVRASAQRAVDVLQRSSTVFLQNGFVRDTAKCVSCHQQALPAAAFALARERGLEIDEHAVARLFAATVATRADEVESARQLDRPTPGGGLTLGYDANGLGAFGYEDDGSMSSFSRYLLSVQLPDGSWKENVRRPPMSDGPIVFTTWTLRAVQLYPPTGHEEAAAGALQRARAWLARQSAHSHNDRVFQLLGLAWTGESRPALEPLIETLLQTQGEDGGWAQLPGREPDAWATGSALVALHHAGLAPTHEAYERGITFLLRTQFDDGSWWVRSRSWPFQPHFDGKFPHGKDQWISAAGSAWATIALLQTLQPTVARRQLPNAHELIAAFQQSAAKAAHPALASVESEATPETAVDFLRDIRPVLERSCAGCHGGARPKAGFILTSREALLRGGQSGDPAIVPGDAEASPLYLQVAGQVEDLEMPPLNRRGKYPGLSAEELQRFRAWINAGAPWAPEPSNEAVASTTKPENAFPDF